MYTYGHTLSLRDARPVARSLGDLRQPAIRFARDGFAVTERVHRDWHSETETLSHDPATAGIYLPGGVAPALGSVQRQPLLAASLERIAKEGRDAFYTGRSEKHTSELQVLMRN